MTRVQKIDRRKVNVATGDERRGKAKDRRKCPKCGSSIQQNVEPSQGGTRTLVYCTKCDWQAESRQVDEEKMKKLLGFEGMIVGNTKKPMLELSPGFLQSAGLKPGDTVEIKPLYSPGGDKVVSWIIKGMED